MIHTPKTKTGLSKKLTHQWSGPYYINKVLSEIRYLLADSKGKPLKSPIHANHQKSIKSYLQTDFYTMER